MAKKTYYCPNHPDTVAPYQCHVCEKRMCYNCSIRSFGKFYCSIKCLVTDITEKFVSLLFQVFSGIWAVLTYPFTRKNGSLRHAFVEIFLVAALGGAVFIAVKLNRTIDSMLEEKQAPAAASADTTVIKPPSILTPNKDGMVIHNTITIQGTAEKGRIISLLKDNQIVDVKLIREGPFAFENIKLLRGTNKIQVRALSSDGRASDLQTITLTYAPPSLSYMATNLNRGPVTSKRVAFTFDAGAENNAASAILDTLKSLSVKATFFLTGRFIKHYPETVMRIVNEGHETGNHTLTHPHMTTYATNRRHNTLPSITKNRIMLELGITDSLFFELTGRHMSRLWRAPYGEFNREILMWAAQCGYRHIGWTRGRTWDETLDTMDWVHDKNSSAYHSAAEIRNKVVGFGRKSGKGAGGVIILMHLGTNRTNDLPHLELGTMINGLRNRGYIPVTISQLTGDTYISAIRE